MIETAVVLEKPADYRSQSKPPDYDGLWKKVIGQLFEEFMLFFAPDLYEEIDFSKGSNALQQELYPEFIQKKEGRELADKIFKVYLKNGEEKWILIHIEVQNKDEEDFSKRMFRYFYRIYDQHNQEVYAIALLTDTKKFRYPNHFHYSFFGTEVNYKEDLVQMEF